MKKRQGLSRRDLMKSGGALIVGFSFASSFPISPPSTTHARNTAKNPIRFENVDELTYLWIHSAGMP